MVLQCVCREKILAENGGLEVALDPEGVLGIWKVVGAWRLPPPKRELVAVVLWLEFMPLPP